MTNEITKYEEMAMITIKPLEREGSLIYRFIKWRDVDALVNEVNTKRVFKLGNEVFPSRNFEKSEKHNGIVPDKRVLAKVEEKIRKYRSTFYTNPPEGTLNRMTENAYKELNIQK